MKGGRRVSVHSRAQPISLLLTALAVVILEAKAFAEEIRCVLN